MLHLGPCKSTLQFYWKTLFIGSTENGDFDNWFGPTGKENITEKAFDIPSYHQQVLLLLRLLLKYNTINFLISAIK